MAKIKGRQVLFCGSGDRGTGMLSAQGILQGLNSVSVYNSAYDLLSEETVLPNLEEDFCGFLRHFEDFEAIGYLCLNNETVVMFDSVNGDVMQVQNIDDVLPTIREFYEDSLE